jgi:hypothetical protein
MKKITYSALDTNGQEKSGFVDAENNRQALEKLQAIGFSAIRFYDDGALSLPRDDLDGLTPAEIERTARLEMNNRRKPGYPGFILGVLRENLLLTLAGAGLLIWGIADRNPYLLITGAAAGLLMPILSTWNYRVVNDYNRLLAAFAEGRWDDTLTLVGRLRKHSVNTEMKFDLDLREAYARLKNHSFAETIENLEIWRARLEQDAPGMYESRVAAFYHFAGRYDESISLMRQANRKSSMSPTISLDLALFEARLGDSQKAKLLLEKVDPETLPVTGHAFVDWIRGLICHEEADNRASEYLLVAIAGLLKLGGGPAIWPSLALCVGDYALETTDKSSRPRAQKLLETVWPVLRVHGEKSLRETLSQRYPEVCC